MAVSSISPIRRLSNAVFQRVVNVVPKMTVNSENANKALAWVGEKMTSPHNRFILGATALMTQPFIDLNNKRVDEETRKVSAARTVAKITAGTTTGVLIRSGCIHAIEAFSKLPEEITPDMKFKKFRQMFTPNTKTAYNMKKYKNSLGTILSVFIMMFTNFLIDAPLTKFLTNKFIAKIKEKENTLNLKNNSKEIKEVHNE